MRGGPRRPTVPVRSPATAVEVDLVAESLGERGRRPLGVVAGAVEASVDGALDAPADGLEQGEGERAWTRRRRASGPGSRRSRSACSPTTSAGEHDEQDAGDDRPRDRPRLMMPVDLVQAVAQDRDPDRDRDERDAGEDEQREAGRGRFVPRTPTRRSRTAASDATAANEPLELLALRSAGRSIPAMTSDDRQERTISTRDAGTSRRDRARDRHEVRTDRRMGCRRRDQRWSPAWLRQDRSRRQQSSR